MTRTALSTANRAQATGVAVSICELVSIAFPSGTLYLTSAARDLSYDGQTWVAGATLVQVGGPTESADGKARPITLQLSGADSTLMSKVMQDSYQMCDVETYLGFLDASGNLVDAPYPMGVMLYASASTVTLEDGGAAISLECETDDIWASRDSAVLVTDASQQQRYAGDTGMQYVVAISDLTVKWGGIATVVGTTGRSSSGSTGDDAYNGTTGKRYRD